KGRESRGTKLELLRSLVSIPGLYVPSLYEVVYRPDQTIEKVVPKTDGIAEKISYRQSQLSESVFPLAPVVPFVQTVHDRLNVEIQRGCPWRCRFCQAGFSYHTYRERGADQLLELVKQGLANTGYDAVTLAGLSAADHREIIPLLQTLSQELTPRRVSIGLPSTRADRFTLALAELLHSVRRQSLTFAPEAGTERLRRVIRKELEESEIRETLRFARQHGWKNVKLYFMFGLPTETQEDLAGVAELVRHSKKENVGMALTCTLSPFVPKPHTPFQWHPQDRQEILKQKLGFLRKNLSAQIRAHGLEQIELEGVLSRGDRRCSHLLERAWQLGAKFDEWGERFRPEIWQRAFQETGLSPEFFCYRSREESETFPWDHIEGGPEKRALWNDYQTSLRQAESPLTVPHLKERPLVPLPIPQQF
ncbi:MAG: radical SAM protein, partial [Elusimicrobia bacterium]|nr:radical SAM protein [Elusimicrobiota bacterium]